MGGPEGRSGRVGGCGPLRQPHHRRPRGGGGRAPQPSFGDLQQVAAAHIRCRPGQKRRIPQKPGQQPGPFGAYDSLAPNGPFSNGFFTFYPLPSARLVRAGRRVTRRRPRRERQRPRPRQQRPRRPAPRRPRRKRPPAGAPSPSAPSPPGIGPGPIPLADCLGAALLRPSVVAASRSPVARNSPSVMPSVRHMPMDTPFMMPL